MHERCFFKADIFIFCIVFVFSACEDLSFTNEDFFSSETKTVKEKEILNTESQTENKNLSDIALKDSEQISEEEITVLSKDLELLKDTIIQNKKVILDMVTIQTNEHDLTVIADEFIISIILLFATFPEGQMAKEKEEGKSGGHVLIKANTAKGSLGLTLGG